MKPRLQLSPYHDLPSTIMVNETIEQFGYDPHYLKPNSWKLVVKKFECCGMIANRKFVSAITQHKCQKCSNVINSQTAISREKRSIFMKLCNQDPNYKHPTKGIGHSEETKKNMGKWRIGKTLEELYGEDHAKEMKIQMVARMTGENNPFFGKHHKEESLRRGKSNCQFGKVPAHTNKVWYERLDGSKVCFRSSWEAKTAKYLDDHRIDWIYEHKTYDLGSSTYLPDFWLPAFNKYIEVKGRWWPGYKEKFDLFREKYPDVNIDIWYRAQLTERGII